MPLSAGTIGRRPGAGVQGTRAQFCLKSKGLSNRGSHPSPSHDRLNTNKTSLSRVAMRAEQHCFRGSPFDQALLLAQHASGRLAFVGCNSCRFHVDHVRNADADRCSRRDDREAPQASQRAGFGSNSLLRQSPRGELQPRALARPCHRPPNGNKVIHIYRLIAARSNG